MKNCIREIKRNSYLKGGVKENHKSDSLILPSRVKQNIWMSS